MTSRQSVILLRTVGRLDIRAHTLYTIWQSVMPAVCLAGLNDGVQMLRIIDTDNAVPLPPSLSSLHDKERAGRTDGVFWHTQWGDASLIED